MSFGITDPEKGKYIIFGDNNYKTRGVELKRPESGNLKDPVSGSRL